ncbi:MAG: GntR family transcriptional regulator [Hyphomicrobiaceae bacterium]|nr:GntR family transcriptional regulator [Hyphomicrobiaceae bacterium]
MYRFQTRPLYLQVSDALLAKIRSKDWVPDQQLPNEQQLAVDFGVSSGTMRKALQILVDKHVLRRVQGRGTFVSSFDAESLSLRFYAFKGYEGYTTVAEAKVSSGHATEDEQRLLDLRPAHRVVRIERLRHMNDSPYNIEEIVIPERLFTSPITEDEASAFILLLCFERAGVLAKSAVERLWPLAADEELATRLEVPLGTALLKSERVVSDSDDRPFELRRRITFLGPGYYEAKLP